MNYSSGVWGLGSISVAEALPTDHALWLTARVLLDAAGGLFLLYLLALGGLTTVALVSSRGRDAQRPLLRSWPVDGQSGAAR